MKIYLYLAVFMGAAVLAGCASKPSPRVEVAPKTAVVDGLAMVQDLHNREIEATKQLGAFQKIAEKTTDVKTHKHADEVLHMLTERGVVVVPTENGIWIPPFADDKDSIRIVVLTHAEEKYGVWKRYFEKNSGAFFDPEYRAVVIKNTDKISSELSGFNLGHEGNHALLFLKNQNIRSRKEFCEEERDTYEFEFRLMASYPGYEQYISKEAARLASSVKKTASGEILFPWSGKYHTELDGIFGPALSEYEKKGRETITWIDIVFHAIDISYTGDKEELKAEFACGVYADKGIIPKE